MTLTRKGHTIVMGAADDQIDGKVLVNKITAVIGAATPDIQLKDRGTAGPIVFDANAAAFAVNTTPSLLTFSEPQWFEDLRLTQLTGGASTVVVHVK